MKIVIENDKVEITLTRHGRTIITEFNRHDRPLTVKQFPLRNWPVLSEHEWAIVNKAMKTLETAAIRDNPPDIDCHVSECLTLPDDKTTSVTLRHSNVFDVKAFVKIDMSSLINIDEANGVISLIKEDVEEKPASHLEVEYGFTVPSDMLYSASFMNKK